MAIALAALGSGAAPVSASTSAHHWVGLGAGRLGPYRWSVEAKRRAVGPHETLRPCLLVATKWQLSPYDFRRSRSRQCADTAGLSASGPPLIASGVQPGVKPRMTAVGMIFGAQVERVRIDLADGDRTTIRLGSLDASEAHDAGLSRLRYATLAVHGRWCPERLVSENAAGKTLWDSGAGSNGCAYDGSPTVGTGP